MTLQYVFGILLVGDPTLVDIRPQKNLLVVVAGLLHALQAQGIKHVLRPAF